MTTILIIGKSAEVHIIRAEENAEKILFNLQHISVSGISALDDLLHMLGYFTEPEVWRCLPNGSDIILMIYERKPPAINTTALSVPQPLTMRQHQILQLLSQGLTNKQIAAQLKIHPNTVSEHTGMIKKRLGVSTRAEFLTKAAASGLVTLPGKEK
jgi:DNA-binding CsgD family transcriptional regulator